VLWIERSIDCIHLCVSIVIIAIVFCGLLMLSYVFIARVTP
jgi:hypothetical protein